ncbi:MAG: DNA mismatch repair endonuclease MutL [Proteobacteria bacterium]|nr:DNA mismatch repair endonuclease MutL [Pseudomonadota bacterium]NOG58987.1 DNA mismatch repair endonuclease MutL [Pseudomonadota bacterium]
MPDNQNFPRIHQLPESVANQIAAGEVIERPASVVKELIENSIDAAASKIDIDIEDAGIGLIRVRDNGQGIYKDDLQLALQPHATSKLSEFSDLSQIASLGFRGEAVPSIASVSRFKMTSRLMGEEQAWSIDNNYKIKPAAHETGTTVEVQDLFFSTPGRRKFLKTEKTEFLHIQSLIRAISLSHFSTGFFVKHDGQSLFRLPACNDDFDQRIKNICGSSFLTKSIRVDVEKDGMHLWGWLGLNDVARSQSDRQYFYVNGRMVRDKHVSHAIRLAYDDRIAAGRFPSFVLHLQLDPSLLDVNVHPAKSEVRFADTRNIHDFIYGALLDSLKQPLMSVAHDNQRDDQSDVQYEMQVDEFGDQQAVNEDVANYQNQEDQTNRFKQLDVLQKRKPPSNYLSLFSGQFVIASVDDDHYLVDIAKSRILMTTLYLLNNFNEKKIIKRPILVPVSCELSDDKLQLIENNTALINQWGFELEQISPTQMMARSIPSRLMYAETISLVKDLLDAISKKQPEVEIAAILAQHVNDSGIELNEESTLQLLSEINFYENSANDVQNLPWRKLEASLLPSLLQK